LGHFAQGFVPAILAREILIRTSPLGGGWRPPPAGRPEPVHSQDSISRPSRWLPFVCASVCLAFSALYELIEWQVAVASGKAADDFLGTQGDPWDTQSDMAFALIGAIVALTF